MSTSDMFGFFYVMHAHLFSDTIVMYESIFAKLVLHHTCQQQVMLIHCECSEKTRNSIIYVFVE
jgi:hypothetical protein